MAHSMTLFRPTLDSYNESDTPMNAFALIVFAVPSFAHLFLWGIGPFGLLTVIIAPIIAGILFMLSMTHEEKPMTISERSLWNKYNCLDSDVRAKIALDIPTLRKIGQDQSQFWDFEREIDTLYDLQNSRKRTEARLDPTTVVMIESVKQAQEEEKQYEHEIRKVLGDFDKAETPEERVRLAQKIRTQIIRR